MKSDPVGSRHKNHATKISDKARYVFLKSKSFAVKTKH
jgi:hypothetical protein